VGRKIRGRNPGEGERATLLIADDDPVVRLTLSAALKHRFEIVATAADGDEAITHAGVMRPDVALVDVDMPAGGAKRAVPGIVDVSPNTAIVVLSADEHDGVVLDLMQAGAVAFLRKGIATGELADKLELSIRARRAERATTS
jgi:DNA-binding NarL/FixJ family response regulator